VLIAVNVRKQLVARNQASNLLSHISRDIRATAQVARLRRAVWPRLCRISCLGCT